MQTLPTLGWQRPSFRYLLYLGYCIDELHLPHDTSEGESFDSLLPLMSLVGEIFVVLEEVAVPVVVGTVTRVERVVLTLGEVEVILLVSPGVIDLVAVEQVAELQSNRE